MFALIDATNFYASAHAVLEPRIKDMAYVVLGNNNGCVIARSEGARRLGVKMGVPWFQIKHLQESDNLFSLSVNFELYSVLSTRMHSIIAGLSDRTEPYSIDESWSCLDGMQDYAQRVQTVRSRILHWLGLPTGAGIGPTKTITKLASHISKAAWRKPGSYPAHYAGLCDLSKADTKHLQDLLSVTSLNDIWGVGSRISKGLSELGLRNAADLANFSPAQARRLYGVGLERTIRELNGISCIPLEEEPQPRQQFACTRSLANPVKSAGELSTIGATFAAQIAEKMRKQEGVCSKVYAFAMTSPFSKGPRYSNSVICDLGSGTADSRLIVSAAEHGMRSIFREGYAIVKVGVILLDVLKESEVLKQTAFDFKEPTSTEKSMRLMDTLDEINSRFGKSSIFLASSKPNLRLQRSSGVCPRYLSSWDELPIVRC